MIERTEDGFEVACDYCSNDIEVSGHDWNEMLAEIKANGWHIRQVNGEWKHMDDECWKKHVRW